MLKMLHAIAAKVGVELDDDTDLAGLEQSTRPDRVLEQIGTAVEQPTDPGKKPDTLA